jgi:hypothetical protein
MLACSLACARARTLSLFPSLSLSPSLSPILPPSLSLLLLASFSPARRSVLGSLYRDESTLIYSDQHFKGRKEIMVSFFIFLFHVFKGRKEIMVSCVFLCLCVCLSVLCV